MQICSALYHRTGLEMRRSLYLPSVSIALERSNKAYDDMDNMHRKPFSDLISAEVSGRLLHSSSAMFLTSCLYLAPGPSAT